MDPYPHTFEDGVRQVASGDQVMANFEHARTAVRAVEAAIAASGAACIIDTEETLTDPLTWTAMRTPDVVRAVVVPDARSLIEIRFQALVREAMAGGLWAAIFIGRSQLAQGAADVAPQGQRAVVATGGRGRWNHLHTDRSGLVATVGTAGDASQVATGQVLGSDVGGGPVEVFCAPGTYDIGIFYMSGTAALGTVTTKQRKLFVDVRARPAA